MDEDSVRMMHLLSRLETYIDRQISIIHFVMACVLGISVGTLAITLAGAM